MRIPRTNFTTPDLHEASQRQHFNGMQERSANEVQSDKAGSQGHEIPLVASKLPPNRPSAGREGNDGGRSAQSGDSGQSGTSEQSLPSFRGPLPALAEIADRFDDAACQSHFFLAPNVRFTRTPDRELTKQSARSKHVVDILGDGRSPAGKGETSSREMPIEARPTIEPQALPATSSEKSRLRASHSPCWNPAQEPVIAAVQMPVAQFSVSPMRGGSRTGPQAPSCKTRRATDPVRPDRPTVPAEPQNPRCIPATRQPSALLSYLSDHAFFELMAEEASVPPSTGAPSEQRNVPLAGAEPVAAEVVPVVVKPSRLPATRVESFYRVIECRPSAPPEAAAPTAKPGKEGPDGSVPQKAGSPNSIREAQPASSRIVIGSGNCSEPPTTTPAATMPVPIARISSCLPPVGDPEQPEPHKLGGYEFPPAGLLQPPREGQGFYMSQEQLEQNAGLLESVLEDFGVRGEIIHVRPGPVVTLYEFEPAPGVKSSRVINLADDIARSMSAISARVAVIPGRNVIGIELPNAERETVYLRELIEADDFRKSTCKLALCLGKTIGGEPVIAELAKMPHLLVAGTTGSGKSVAINTMILSLLYRLKPEQCRLIMVDPKMLELSVYDAIPHLLTPVVTDPKKAVVALKWAVREMEERYKTLAAFGVRNIEQYNRNIKLAQAESRWLELSMVEEEA
jgi:DNA segregation ATPase FtsK/SpoIIIE, S-DNA-T family